MRTDDGTAASTKIAEGRSSAMAHQATARLAQPSLKTLDRLRHAMYTLHLSCLPGSPQ